MAVKLATIQVRVITGTDAPGLEGNIRTFVQSLKEELLVEVRYAAAPGLFSALIVYTV